jgi:hypothetical protein
LAIFSGLCVKGRNMAKRSKAKPPDDPVLLAIKEAHKHPHVLSREETIDFIERPIDMGTPVPLPSGKRGPRTRRTQYDAAYERRKGLYHRLKRLPEKGAEGRRKIGDKTRRDVAEAAKKLPTNKRMPRSKIQQEMARRQMPALHDSTVYRALKKKITPD